MNYNTEQRKLIEEYIMTNQEKFVNVEEIKINDINDRGAFYFSINENTELSWRGIEIKLSDLKEGQNVSITSIGNVLESSPAILTEVAEVIVLDDEL